MKKIPFREQLNILEQKIEIFKKQNYGRFKKQIDILEKEVEELKRTSKNSVSIINSNNNNVKISNKKSQSDVKELISNTENNSTNDEKKKIFQSPILNKHVYDTNSVASSEPQNNKKQPTRSFIKVTGSSISTAVFQFKIAFLVIISEVILLLYAISYESFSENPGQSLATVGFFPYPLMFSLVFPLTIAKYLETGKISVLKPYLSLFLFGMLSGVIMYITAFLIGFVIGLSGSHTMSEFIQVVMRVTPISMVIGSFITYSIIATYWVKRKTKKYDIKIPQNIQKNSFIFGIITLGIVAIAQIIIIPDVNTSDYILDSLPDSFIIFGIIASSVGLFSLIFSWIKIKKWTKEFFESPSTNYFRF